MKRAIGMRIVTGIVLGGVALWVLGCGGEEIASRWRDRPLTVDGSTVEWEGTVRYIPEQRVSVGAMNDGDHLYLTFSTADTRAAVQVLSRGFTVWLAPRGGDRLGVHFPLGRAGGGGPGEHDRDEAAAGPGGREGRGDRDRPGRNGRGGWDGPYDPDEPPDLGRLAMVYRGPDAEVEILGRGEPRRRPISGADGIQVSIDAVHGVLVYELRVPLGAKSDAMTALEAAPGGEVGIQLETARAEFEGFPHPQGRALSGDEDPGGFGGRPSGGGFPGDGMDPGSVTSVPEPLNAHFKLRLATAP